MCIKTYKVYGRDGHRQKGSFLKSTFFKTYDGDLVEILNSDITGTNEYSIVIVMAKNDDSCLSALEGQISDGFFENYRVGHYEEIMGGKL